ncbi:MAG: GNAT family N-acetyltransferase, partial [Bacteroidia bacterium]|nr:GNAT family N-acetyltransferase [Bacteroidia bacterium]
MKDNIKITFYEPWMSEQIIALFCKQYGNSIEQFSEFFSKFYENDFQKNDAIKVVAVSENVVAGFASFCKWPYFIPSKNINSFQCGNVIIGEDFRGKGLYNRMLNFINERHEELKIDLIIGFPIKEIVKLYLKSGWKNPFNLSWYIKPLNIFSIVFPF